MRGALVALALVVAQRSGAQSDQVGRVEGVVFDSVHARALADARVVAVGTGSQTEVRREATTDSIGRYRIDSLPFGRYIVGFENALLDSLEVALSPREVTVTPGQAATLDLALPSAVKLRSAVCLGATLPPETGVIYGHVVSAETESPLAGVELAMAWRDLGLDRSRCARSMASDRRPPSPTSMAGTACAAYRRARGCRCRSSATSAAVPCFALVWTTRSASPRFDTFRSATLSPRASDTTGTVPPTTALGHGDAGRHRSRSRRGARSARRIAGGGHAPPRGGPTRRGAFTLSGLPAGTQLLVVRHIGYAVAGRPVDPAAEGRRRPTCCSGVSP